MSISLPKEKKCTKCKTTLPISQFGKQKDKKSGYRSHCKACRSEEAKKYHQKNKYARSEYVKKRYQLLMAQPEKPVTIKSKTCSRCEEIKNVSEFHKCKVSEDGLRYQCKTCRTKEGEIYRKKNPEKRAETKRNSYQSNKDKYRKTYKQCREEHKGEILARTRKRQAAKIKRTPLWADNLKIKEFYCDCMDVNLAAKLAGCTEKFVVDHIIPLQGKFVSGFHVHNNLQIITAAENAVKSNHFICEAP